MSKHTDTALKEAARRIAAAEGLSYAAARRVAERWAAHPLPTDEELRIADETEFDPIHWYAMNVGEIPGHLMGIVDYPEHRPDGPAPYCYPHPLNSLADPEQTVVLSLTARPAVYRQEPALIVEPLTYTPPPNTHVPGFGYWGNCWSVRLHDEGFRFNWVGNFSAPGWAATVTRGAEPSAPCSLRITHFDGYVLFDEATPLPPNWLARVRVHPEGVPVFCGPCAGSVVPRRLEDARAESMLETGDLTAARIPFTVTEAS